MHFDAAHLGAAVFRVEGDGHYPQAPGGFDVTVSTAPTTGFPTRDTVTFSGYYDSVDGVTKTAWPLVNKDGFSKALVVDGWLMNDCALATAQPVTLNWDFTEQYYATFLGLGNCSLHQTAPWIRSYDPPIIPPGLDVLFDPAHEEISALPATISGITVSYNPGDVGTAVENAYIKITPPPNVTVGSLSVNGVTVSSANAPYYQVGSLTEGDLYRAHITLHDVQFQTCQVGEYVTFSLDYGYCCAKPVKTDADAAKACATGTYPFKVKVAPSCLVMEVYPPSVTTGSACTAFEYRVRLLSTCHGVVRFPRLKLWGPASMAMVSATGFRTDGPPTAQTIGPVTLSYSSSLNSYLFDIDHDLYGGTGISSSSGIPATGAYADLVFHVNFSCGGSGAPGLIFQATALDLCEDALDTALVPTPALTITAGGTQVSTITCPQDKLLACGDSMDPKVNLGLGVATATDTCGQAVASSRIGYTDAPGYCGFDRTWTATNNCGARLTCVQHIGFADATPPQVTTVAGSLNVTLQCSDSAGLAAALALAPTATDTCTGLEALITAGADGVLNSVRSGDDVLVAANGAIGAMITAGADAVLETLVAGDDVISTARLISDVTTPDALCANAYVRERKWKLRDRCGNQSAEFVQTITVVDTAPLVASCPTITVCDSAEAPPALNYGDFVGALVGGTVSGACGTVTPTVTWLGDVITAGACPVYTIARSYQVADACKHTTCIQIISVSPPTSYTINLVQGYNLIANQLDNGAGNTADVLFPNPTGLLDGDEILTYECTGGGKYTVYVFDSACPGFSVGGTCVSAPVLTPGMGFFYYNQHASRSVTFTGTPPCPRLPVPFSCPCGTLELLGRQIPCLGTYENITGLAPQDGTRVLRWNGSTYVTYTFHQPGGWVPPLPPIHLGEAVFISAPCCSNAPTGVALWLPFDELGGPASANRGSVAHPGTQKSGPVGANGLVARSLCFDGASQYVEVPYYPAIDIGTGDFSMDAWVKRGADSPGVQQIVNHRDVVTLRGYALYLNNGVLSLDLRDLNNGTISQAGQTVPPDGNWHFVAVTVQRGAGGGRIFLDNQPVVQFSALAAPASLANASSVLVGAGDAGFAGLSEFFDGCIDEVEIFARALSGPEVTNILSAGVAGNCKPSCPPVCARDKTVECGTVWQFDAPTNAPGCCSNGMTITLVSSTQVSGDPCASVYEAMWQVVDCYANMTTCRQKVTVVDTTPPALLCPAPIISRACDDCRPIYYSVPAFDSCFGPVIPDCNPASGSTFCIGTTLVICTATDPCGNAATCSFPVEVIHQTVIWQSRQLGLADCYKLPTDYAPKSAMLASLTPICWKGFDDTQVNCIFGASFMNLPHDITCGQLWIRMKPNCSDYAQNDTISLGLNLSTGNGPPTSAWGSYIGGSDGQTPSLIPGEWCDQTDCGQLFSFNLANLPHAPTDLRPLINNLHQLDIAVQDDTTVDYARFCYCYCRTRPWWWGWEWDLENAALAIGHDFASVSPLWSLGYATNFSVTLAPGSAHGLQLGLRAMTLAHATNATLTVRGQTTLDPDADAIRLRGEGAGSMSFALAAWRSNITQVQVTLLRGARNICQESVPLTLDSKFLTVAGNASVVGVSATEDGNVYRFTLDAEHEVGGSLCPSNRADAVVVTFLASAHPVDNLLASLTLSAAGLDEIQLSNAAVQVSGLFPSIKGDGVASADGNQVSLSPHDVNSTNPVGFAVDLPGVSVASLSLRPWYRTCWPFGVAGEMNGVIRGRIGTGLVEVGTVSFSQATGQVWAARANFGGLGASGQRFQVFNQGVLVADSVGQTNAGVSFDELPSSWDLASGVGAAVLGVTWPESHAIGIGHTNLLGDELRFMPVGATAAVAAFTGLDVQVIGVEALVLSGITLPSATCVPPLMTSMNYLDGTFVMAFRSQTGLTYQIEYKDSLDDLSWTPLGPPINASSSTTTVTDTLGGNLMRFYRVLCVP